VKKSGKAIFGEVPSWYYGFAVGTPQFDFSPQYNYEVLEPGDTVKLQQYNQVCFPFYIAYLNKGSVFISSNDKLTNSSYEFPDGLGRPTGVYELLNNQSHSWTKPRFTANAYADNELQIDTAPSTINNPVIYYEYDNLKNNTLRLITSGHPFSILGQSGQSTIDCDYQIPEQSSGTTYFPAINLIQASVNGKAVDVVNPDQSGIVRLILDRRDSSIASVNLSLLLPSGEEVVLPVRYINEREYDAIIPAYIPKGFIDVIARVEDTQGNRCELNASPAFYFGNTTDNIRLDARLRMSSYALNNVEAIKMQTGDTLKYTLSYTNYGSDIARNVVVTFPTTPFFKPAGPQSWTIDSLAVNDTVQVPVSLLFLGRQQSSDAFTHYAPSLTWTSGGTTYRRNQKILVDFQNTITGDAKTNSPIPRRFELYQNYPNPFNPSTTIKYDLPKESRVKIVVYDILGRKVATLVDEMKKAGSYQVIWDANRLASGVYFYRTEAVSADKRFVDVKKMILVK
jgi:hypothetical protein